MLKDKETNRYTNPISACSVISDKVFEMGDREHSFEIEWEARQAANLRAQLKGQAEHIKEKMDALLDQLAYETEGGYASLNSLGELQAQGPALDVLVARYCDARDRLEKVVRQNDTCDRYE